MIRISCVAILIISLVSSCQKVFEKPSWETEVVAPLVTTSLGIDNILKDTSFAAHGDTVKFVRREKLYDLNIDSLVKLQVNPYFKNVKLSKLELEPQAIVRRVSLGELAKAMVADGNATGGFILLFNGQNYNVPDIDNLTAGPMDVDLNQFFEYAEMNNPGGTMQIKIENGLPLTIKTLEFELKNKTLSQPPTSTPPIAHETFVNLTPNTSQTSTIDLSDKIMEGDMEVNVLDMDMEGGYIMIDTSDAITITITIQDVSVRNATAIFPAQDVVNEDNETSLEGMGDIRLRRADIQTGEVYAEAYSTSEDTIYFTYTIPSARKGGINGPPFVMEAIILPDPIGGTKQTFSADFSGYTLDLTGKLGHDTVNTFHNILTGNIHYTGKKVNLSLDDSLYIVVTMRNVTPTFIEGYLGRDTIDIGAGSVDFDIFKRIESGTLNFEKAKVNLVIENGLGLDGEFVLNNLRSENTRTGQQRTLSGLPIIGAVQKAIKAPLTTVTTTIPIGGSSIVDLLNIMPDKIHYDVQLRVNNQDYIQGIYPDFAHKGSPLNPYLDIELPLSILADQIVLSDTVDFIQGDFKTSVNSGSFTLLVNNGFPIGGDLKIYFLDMGGIAIDSVVSAGNILPGIPNAQGRVTEKMSSKITFFVDETRMQNILRANNIAFKVKFSTPNAAVPGSFVKLFSDYKMDFKLVGDFNYMIE